MAWNLAQAKEHLEEIARRADDGEPQMLEIGGAEYVIVAASSWRSMLNGAGELAGGVADEQAGG